MTSPLVRMTGLVKRYREGDRERVILDGANGEIVSGEFVALVGRSGSGKSTLLNLVSGIDEADAGRVEIDGNDLATLGETARTQFRRRRIGFVFQFFNLIPTLTVLENVLLPLELDGRVTAEQRAHALALLEDVGLKERAQAWPDRLSGGEQQRVAVARALVHGPRLLLADEPTGNLDEASGQRVMDRLQALCRRQGTAVLMVTHSRELAARADRVLSLSDGRLVSTGAT